MPTSQQAWIINHYATGELKGSELELVSRPIPEVREGEVLIKTLLLSLDASNRLWLSKEKDYLPQLQIGDVMRGLVLGCVEQSRHPNFKQGDYLFALLGWQEYAVVHGDQLTPKAGAIKFKRHPDIPLDAYVSALGLTGWSAFVGMRCIGEVHSGQTVLVSGAAGATGVMACQIAKAANATVVGIAGGQDKCHYLTEQLGLADCIDYRDPANATLEGLTEAIRSKLPNGVDLFFDNVGGPILDAALSNMSTGGRIIISGSISQYDKDGDTSKIYGVKNTFMLASKRLRMEGFLIMDWLERLDEILPTLEKWLLEGKLQYRNDEVDGLENAQQALPKLFSGRTNGKLVINIAKPDNPV